MMVQLRKSRLVCGVLAVGLLLFAAGAKAQQNQPSPLPAQSGGQPGQVQQIQLRLTNSTGQGVDAYYVRPDTGAPEYVKSISPGETIDMSSIQGMVWLFAIQRRQFQSYTTRSEPFQGLTLAPAGQQQPPQLAMEFQPPGGQIQQNPRQPATPALAQRPLAQPQNAPLAGGAPNGGAAPQNYGNQPGLQPRQPALAPSQIPQNQPATGGIPAYAPGARPPENSRPPAENAAFGPSFSCRGGGLTPTEGRLCNNEELGSLDREIVDVYRWVKSRFSGIEQTKIKNDQRRWLQRRNSCGARDDCIRRAYLDRRGSLNTYLAGGQATSPASAGAASFPHPAMSLGAKVRSGPGTGYRRITGLKNGERISLLEQSNAAFYQDMPWFKIRFRGRIGYHWGGAICAVGSAVPGTYEVC